MSRELKLLLLLPFCLSLHAQLPESEVWLFKIERKKGELLIKPVGNISNRSGYDNQPRFSEDNKTLYYVSNKGERQTEVLVYALSKKRTTALTGTAESEYSPFPVNGSIACVVVEADSSQRIYLLNEKDGSALRRLNPDSVGYHCFLNQDTLAYYRLGQPATLHLHVISTGEDRWLADKPTRSLFAAGRNKLIYGITEDGSIHVYLYDLLIRKGKKIASYRSASEDFFYDERHGLLRAEEGRILQYDPATSAWNELFNLTSFGVKNIGRLTLSADGSYLAVVVKS